MSVAHFLDKFLALELLGLKIHTFSLSPITVVLSVPPAAFVCIFYTVIVYFGTLVWELNLHMDKS